MKGINGFVRLHRRFLEWEWYDDIVTKTVFIHLLLTASYREYKWQGITIKPGQVVTSYSALAKKLNLGVRQVRTAIEHLKSTNELTSESTSKYTVVTIVNWAKYQSLHEEPTSKTTNKVTNDRQATDKQPTSNRQHLKKYNNINKYNNYNNSLLDTHAREEFDGLTDAPENDDFFPSETFSDNDEGEVPHIWHGELGEGVLLMSDSQFEHLCEIIPLDVLEGYVKKIVNYTNEKGKTVKNHFGKIMTWYKADFPAAIK
jgi:hypothetical protein